MVSTKKEKTSTMHKQYTLHNREVHKKIWEAKKMQVQRKKGSMAEQTWQEYLYLPTPSSLVPSTLEDSTPAYNKKTQK